VLFKFYNKVDQDFKTCQEKGFINDFGTDDRGYIAETREELLNKLPKNVIKNGKIIPIRDEIAKNFKNNPGLLKAKGIEDRCDKEGDVTLVTETSRKEEEDVLTSQEK